MKETTTWTIVNEFEDSTYTFEYYDEKSFKKHLALQYHDGELMSDVTYWKQTIIKKAT